MHQDVLEYLIQTDLNREDIAEELETNIDKLKHIIPDIFRVYQVRSRDHLRTKYIHFMEDELMILEKEVTK